MAGRSRDTYKKRQKEVARAEKKQEKLARRLERKKNEPDTGDDLDALAIDTLDTDAYDADGNRRGIGSEQAEEIALVRPANAH